MISNRAYLAVGFNRETRLRGYEQLKRPANGTRVEGRDAKKVADELQAMIPSIASMELTNVERALI